MIENIEEKIQKASTTLATMLDYLGLEAVIKSKEKNGRIFLTAVSEDAGRIIGRRGKTLEDLQLLINKMINKGDEAGPKIVIDVDGYSKKTDNRRREEGSAEPDGNSNELDGESVKRERRDDRPRRRDRDDRGDSRGGRSDRSFGRGSDRRGPGEFRQRRPASDSGEDMSDAERENIVRLQALDAAKEVKKWGEPVSLPPMNSRDRRFVHLALQDDTEIIGESREGDDSNFKSVVISIKK